MTHLNPMDGFRAVHSKLTARIGLPFLALAVMLSTLLAHPSADALRKAAGKTEGGDVSAIWAFSDGLAVPALLMMLGILPLGIIALGFVFFTGNRQAAAFGGKVLGGIVLILGAPGIVL